jgi:hypothetical protein
MVTVAAALGRYPNRRLPEAWRIAPSKWSTLRSSTPVIVAEADVRMVGEACSLSYRAR